MSEWVPRFDQSTIFIENLSFWLICGDNIPPYIRRGSFHFVPDSNKSSLANTERKKIKQICVKGLDVNRDFEAFEMFLRHCKALLWVNN